MAQYGEAALVEADLAVCPACVGEIAQLRDMQHFLASVGRPEAPKHLEMEARVRLSHVRHADTGEGWLASILETIQPMAIRAMLGVSASVLLFGALSLALATQTALANTGPDPGYRKAQPTENAKIWMAGHNETAGLNGHILIEAYVGADGYLTGFRVVEGDQSPETLRLIWDRLYFAQFYPATSFGMPVSSSVILSFVAVES
jgi:hypothetical protein